MMDDKEFEVDEIANEYLAEEMCCDADQAYDVWRDRWRDNLREEIIKLYADFVKPIRHGYYSGMIERFTEHVISDLALVTECDIRVNDGSILAVRREKVEGDTNTNVVTEITEGYNYGTINR
jgi:hypothetical protein